MTAAFWTGITLMALAMVMLGWASALLVFDYWHDVQARSAAAARHYFNNTQEQEGKRQAAQLIDELYREASNRVRRASEVP